MKIFELTGPIIPLALDNIFKFIPPFWTGLGLLGVGSVYLLYSFFRNQNDFLEEKNLFSPPLVASFIYIGTFICRYALIDEVAVNLEHAFNLFHFGKFSMSPDAMIDGTVELIYYLLHTPFASSQATLILGNFLICLTTGWFHLFILWNFWGKQKSMHHTLLLSGFAVFIPLIEIFASGFGNSLLSLVFLAALCGFLKNRISVFLILSGLLPLIRPDGILFSIVCALTFATHRFLKKQKMTFPEAFLAFGLPFMTLGIYFIAFHTLYGHWIPTPVLFKRISLSMLHLLSIKTFIGEFVHEYTHPAIMIPFLILIFGWLIYLRHKITVPDSQKKLLIMFLLLIPLPVLFLLSKNILNVLHADLTPARYWTPLLIILSLASLMLLRQFDLHLSGQKIRKSYALGAFFMIFLTLSVSNLFAMVTLKSGNSLEYINRSYAAVAGSFADRVAPKNLTLATSEMNTFGLGSKRFVADLYGYSTRMIATSKECSAERLRKNINYFSELQPDIVWLYWFTHHAGAYTFERAEAGLTVHALGEYHGNMAETVQNYDLVILKNDSPNYPLSQIGYLVNKSASESFREALTQNGFIMNRTRNLKANFINEFPTKSLRSQPCG